MSVLRATVGMLALASCAAPAEWLVARHCAEPYPLPPFRIVECSDTSLPFARCLYVEDEPGIQCVLQVERETCDGLWDVTAHSCAIHSPHEKKAWELPK